MKAMNLAGAAAEHWADVVALPQFYPKGSVDYQSHPATLSACSSLDMKANAANLLDDAAAERVYQLNHAYIPSPTPGRTVQYENKLFLWYSIAGASQKRSNLASARKQFYPSRSKKTLTQLRTLLL